MSSASDRIVSAGLMIATSKSAFVVVGSRGWVCLVRSEPSLRQCIPKQNESARKKGKEEKTKQRDDVVFVLGVNRCQRGRGWGGWMGLGDGACGCCLLLLLGSPYASLSSQEAGPRLPAGWSWRAV
jgi:hypothetical protein